MKIITLWGQRIERYKGEYAPELLAAIDEFGNDDYPQYLDDEESNANKNNEFSVVRRIVIQIPQKDFEEQLYGKVIKGEIGVGGE